MSEPSAIFELIHSLVSKPEAHLSISEMCHIAGVSRSGYYAWVKAAPIREAQEERDRKVFDINGVGIPREHAEYICDSCI